MQEGGEEARSLILSLQKKAIQTKSCSFVRSILPTLPVEGGRRGKGGGK